MLFRSSWIMNTSETVQAECRGLGFSRLAESRWSPRGYDGRPIADDTLRVIFEAARSAQSSYNEQPWRFLVAAPGSPLRAELEACLDAGNAFAAGAWILGLAAAKRTFSKDGRTNRHAAFDTGAACQMLALQAFASGLGTRFMAGFDGARAAALCPADCEPIAFFAIGHPSAEALEKKPARRRKALGELVSGQVWAAV